MRRIASLTIVLVTVQLAWLARAVPPERSTDGVIPDDSRWSSFVRILYGRWENKAEAPPGAPAVMQRQFWDCVEDSWFVAYAEMMRGGESPCGQLLRVAHPAKSDAGAGWDVRNRYKAAFSRVERVTSFSAFHECVGTALEAGDTKLLKICSAAMAPRERFVAALADDDRFSNWIHGCKKVMLADAPVITTQATGDEGIRAARAAMTALEKSQARHCFRSLPSFYQVKGMKTLSQFWTPAEQRELYLRSQKLGRE